MQKATIIQQLVGDFFIILLLNYYICSKIKHIVLALKRTFKGSDHIDESAKFCAFYTELVTADA